MDLHCLKNKEITIIGHDNGDVDSIVSGILLHRLLNYLGIKSYFTILDEEIEEKVSSILLKYNIDVLDYINNTTTDYLFLVDHHETNHSGFVVGAIDHHLTLKSFDYDCYLNMSLASTSLHIYHLMLKYDYPISKDDANLIVLGAYTDTCSLRSSKITKFDKYEVHDLINLFDLNEETFYKDGLLLRDLSLMSLDSILGNGLKRYKFGNYVVNSTYLRVGKLSEVSNIKSSLVDMATNKIKSQNINTWVFVIVALEDFKTLEITITSNSITYNLHEGILSRGKDIIPRIEKQYLIA